MNISSNYDYYSQINSSLIWQKMFQKGNSDDKSNVQDLVQSIGSTTQASASMKPESPLADLVSDGTITSEQEQAIKEALETARMAYSTQAGAQSASGNSTFSDPLSSLVSSGTITEEQKNAVSSTLHFGMKAHGMQGMPPPSPPPQSTDDDSESDTLSSILDSLVEAGTLTDDQKGSVLSALQSAFQSNTTGSSETGTDSAGGTDPLDSLVAAGTITNDQKDEIESAFEEAISARQMMPPPPPDVSQDTSSDTLTSVLDKLVETGAITSEQQQTISSLFQSAIRAYSAQSYSGWDLLSNSYEMDV